MGSRNGGIWKFSMKKFGTPIAAGPGSENEKVGFDGEGTPPEPRGAGGAGAPAFAGLLFLFVADLLFLFAAPPPPVPELPVEPGLEPGFFGWLLPVGPC